MSESLINSLKTEELEVERFTEEGEWVKGRYREGRTECIMITASVQPMTPKETLLLPEARRTRESLKIYTHERLFTADEKIQRTPDIILHDNKRFEVLQVSNWQIGTCLPHYKAIAVKIEKEGGERE